ncbi:MAG TPA: hypothetical protein VN259_16245 [Xanthomonadales bacterium]|nr:hypothetical protein [Xanthomonadales bacterium]
MMRLLLALLALLPAAAWADYKSDYRDGIAAAERQEWAKADALMRKALAQEPNPQPRIRLYGQVFVPYVPQFYLGLSAFARKDCKSAMALLEEVGNVNAVRGQRMEERQQMMLRSCRAQLASSAAPAQPPAANPGSTLPVTPAPTTVKPAAPVPVAKPAPVATAPVASAPKPVTVTPPPVAKPVAVFDTARAQAAQARLDRVAAALAAAARTMADPALAQVRADWQRQADPLSAQAARIQSSLNAAIQARDMAALSSIDAPLARLQPAADQLLQGLNAAQARSALAAQVRGRLQPLAAAYFGGDFARAAQWADEQSLAAVPQAHAQALLLRAAARFELYVLGGERDLAQFDLIGQDIRAARRLSDGIRASESAFPPRFRALFASTR